MLRAQSPTKAPQLLASSAATGMSVTGTTNETALATVTIPAGAMGTNGGLHIYTTWSVTNSANNKTMRIRLGGIAGTIFFGLTVGAQATHHDFRRIMNRGSASSQIASTSSATSVIFGSTTAAATTGAIDTSVAQDLVFAGVLVNTGETITLESYEVWLIPG